MVKERIMFLLIQIKWKYFPQKGLCFLQDRQTDPTVCRDFLWHYHIYPQVLPVTGGLDLSRYFSLLNES